MFIAPRLGWPFMVATLKGVVDRGKMFYYRTRDPKNLSRSQDRFSSCPLSLEPFLVVDGSVLVLQQEGPRRRVNKV